MPTTHSRVRLRHIFIDHSNIWGGARLANRVRHPKIPDDLARLNVRKLDQILGGTKIGTSTRIVSGGIPPGMEGLWAEYQRHGYDTQRLFRGKDWKERGVDHSIIGHMWRLVSRSRTAPIDLVLASGDGSRNEFGTSFLEVIDEVLSHREFTDWHVNLVSFHWDPPVGVIRSPTNSRMLRLVESSQRAGFTNLMDHYDRLVYHEKK
jgi:hypothetical protein